LNLRTWLYIPLILAVTASSPVLAAGEQAAAQRALKITALDWEPYTGSSMVHGGNAIQHLRTILGQCNIDLQVEFYPWRRAQQIAHQPGYLGFFPAWPIEVREGFVSSGEVTPSQLALMAMADSDVQVDEIDEAFASHSIGIVKSYIYPERFQSLLQRFPDSIDRGASSELSLLKMLSMGRFHLAVSDPTVMEYLAIRHGIDDVRVARMLFEEPLVIAMRDEPDNQENIVLVRRLLQAQTATPPEGDLCLVAR
jgi:polar amino acid transport system substrate-binding protein